jgi:uncharacterized protein YndB with AHSA1/START domain
MASASVKNVTDKAPNGTTGDRSVTITRSFEAPRALVFKMFTDETHFARWFGPQGHNVQNCKVEPRIGGRFYAELKGPDGNLHRVMGVFKEVQQDRRVAFTWTWLNEQGAPRSPDLDTLVTIDLADKGKNTELTLVHTGFENADQASRHNSGWNSCFVCLDEYLAEVLD